MRLNEQQVTYVDLCTFCSRHFGWRYNGIGATGYQERIVCSWQNGYISPGGVPVRATFTPGIG